MKKFILWSATVALVALKGFAAAVLPAEKLLPDDTLVFLCAPDCLKLRSSFGSSSQGQLWADPAMKPFKDNFLKKFSADMVGPLEKELGLKFSDYQELAQGQFALAMTQNGWDGKSDET